MQIALLLLLLADAVSATSLDERVRGLQEWLYKKPVVNMNMDRWKTYVRSTPRNYSMMVMFTALSQGVNCPICKCVNHLPKLICNSRIDRPMTSSTSWRTRSAMRIPS